MIKVGILNHYVHNVFMSDELIGASDCIYGKNPTAVNKSFDRHNLVTNDKHCMLNLETEMSAKLLSLVCGVFRKGITILPIFIFS